jgi:exodeoxyribonuclease VII small subunit
MAKTAGKKPEGSTPDFESALTRLEEIVEKLDDGNLPLAQSLALFKEGTALAARCREMLNAAELAVKEALKGVRAGELDESDVEATDNEEDGQDSGDDDGA